MRPDMKFWRWVDFGLWIDGDDWDDWCDFSEGMGIFIRIVSHLYLRLCILAGATPEDLS